MTIVNAMLCMWTNGSHCQVPSALQGGPKTSLGNDSMVIFVEKLNKIIHIRKITKTMTTPQLAQLYLVVIFVNDVINKVLVIDRSTHFTSLFWKTLYSFFKTKLTKSTIYHTQTYDQSEIANRTKEYMIHIFII